MICCKPQPQVAYRSILVYMLRGDILGSYTAIPGHLVVSLLPHVAKQKLIHTLKVLLSFFLFTSGNLSIAHPCQLKRETMVQKCSMTFNNISMHDMLSLQLYEQSKKKSMIVYFPTSHGGGG